MPRFGQKSASRLQTCHPDLIRLFEKVVYKFDCSILDGHRNKERQDKAFELKRSKVQYPYSKHNKYPSTAIDVAPYPIDWGENGGSAQRRKAIARFYYFAGYVKGIAEDLQIEIRWGGDWDGDREFTDQSFDDLPHFELVQH